ATAALAILVRRDPRWEPVVLGPVVAATLASLQPPDRYPGHDAALLGVVGVSLTAAAFLARRWVAGLAGVAFLGVAALAGWAAQDWPLWTLGVAYSAAGVPLFVALTPHRRYEAATDADVLPTIAAQLLSWAGAVAGPLVAAAAVSQRVDASAAVTGVHTVEYRALIALVAALAPLLAFEGRRFRQPLAYVAASAVLVVAGVMTIAIREPSNVQAYTQPVGVYLIVLGIVLRRSSAILPRNLYLHEAIELLGAAVIVLPQAEQSFEPGGARWGFALIVESILFLVLAFALSARWLAVAAVLTLSGVALRWLAESGDTIPYWLTLGLVGLGLLGLGFLLLARQDWWAALRTRTSRWWTEAPGER
ncbi:MAG: hypothetical protein K1X87_10640, partial [Dehalococcoidia bacterium]|nr:hypothetical protein [Dehalococcoidia bacterium]